MQLPTRFGATSCLREQIGHSRLVRRRGIKGTQCGTDWAQTGHRLGTKYSKRLWLQRHFLRHLILLFRDFDIYNQQLVDIFLTLAMAELHLLASATNALNAFIQICICLFCARWPSVSLIYGILWRCGKKSSQIPERAFGAGWCGCDMLWSCNDVTSVYICCLLQAFAWARKNHNGSR